MPSCRFRVPMANVGLGVTGEMVAAWLSDKDGSMDSLLAATSSVVSASGLERKRDMELLDDASVL